MSGTPKIPVKMAGGRSFPASARHRINRANSMPQFIIERSGTLYRPDACFPGNGDSFLQAQDRPQLTKPALDKLMAIFCREEEAAGRGTGQARREAMLPHSVLYGRLYLDHRKVDFEFVPNPRLFTWQSDLKSAGPPEDAEAERAHKAAVADQVAENNKVMEETEESEDSDSGRVIYLADKEEPTSNTNPFSKPSLKIRIGNTVRRTLSRLSTRKRSNSKTETMLVAESVIAPPREVFSRLSVRPSIIARVGSPAVAAPKRRLKFCLLGPAGCGKTTFVGRVLTGEVIKPLHTFAAPPVQGLLTADNKRPIEIELWDFPGTVSQEMAQQMMGNFFHAAIICYGIDDKASAETVNGVWKPMLDRALIECPLYVVGLKKDLRAEAPTPGGLAFSPVRKQVTEDLGLAIAQEARANGFAEVSATSGEGVADAWRAIVNGVVAMTREGERARARLIRRERAKSVAVDAGAVVVGTFARKKSADE
ncbi:P-loop containing nucleoside triphosphate hydrolase protein [Lasiosphaeris hirsuta]|uniref:P-loop containing nucleoside triphosphate hydrolase protein n=1 Tax=Lasiosphaeris hirsuta TaxID=260670 RepID=A0AA39ZW92_9PEZI|nr:P-loop containing nucleoside triphosphate hydrolase protein [Lasiosphaeris hirsuta]